MEGLDEEPGVEGGDDNGDGVADVLEGVGVGELAHFGAVAGELHEREDGEAQLHREDDLREDEQVGGAALAVEEYDEDGGDDGDRAGDEAAEPGLEGDVEEALHDDLAGEGSVDGGGLVGGEQR